MRIFLLSTLLSIAFANPIPTERVEEPTTTTNDDVTEPTDSSADRPLSFEEYNQKMIEFEPKIREFLLSNGVPEQGIDEYFKQRFHLLPMSVETQKAAVEWGKKYGVEMGGPNFEAIRNEIIDAVSNVFLTNYQTSLTIKDLVADGILTEEKQIQWKAYVDQLPEYERKLMQQVFIDMSEKIYKKNGVVIHGIEN